MSEKKKEKRHYGAGCSSELQKRAFFHRIALEGQEKKKRERERSIVERREKERKVPSIKKKSHFTFCFT